MSNVIRVVVEYRDGGREYCCDPDDPFWIDSFSYVDNAAKVVLKLRRLYPEHRYYFVVECCMGESNDTRPS